TFAGSRGSERTTRPPALRGASARNLCPGRGNNFSCARLYDPDCIFSSVLARVGSRSAATNWRRGKECDPLVAILFHVTEPRSHRYRFRTNAGHPSLRFLPHIGSFIWRYGPGL